MKDFTDRIPLNPGRRKITHENGTSEYVTVEMADNPTVIGTPLNREAFMALQGFEAFHVTFNDDGSITETNALNEPLDTVFPIYCICARFYCLHPHFYAFPVGVGEVGECRCRRGWW